jgi:hypothetical protein
MIDLIPPSNQVGMKFIKLDHIISNGEAIYDRFVECI